MVTTDPIHHEVRVACDPDEAFAIYTRRIGEWWDRSYTANAETFQTVTIEPRVGGRHATHSDLGDVEWGVVVVWDPGRRLEHTFTLAQDTNYPSHVAVDFVAEAGDACAVRFAHGGWNDDNTMVREKFGNWPILLNGLAALARTSGDNAKPS